MKKILLLVILSTSILLGETGSNIKDFDIKKINLVSELNINKNSSEFGFLSGFQSTAGILSIEVLSDLHWAECNSSYKNIEYSVKKNMNTHVYLLLIQLKQEILKASKEKVKFNFAIEKMKSLYKKLIYSKRFLICGDKNVLPLLTKL